MKCNECLKELNEMTLYCDRCGAQLSDSKMTLSFDKIEEYLLPINIDSNLSLDHKEEVKTAYFLSHIRKDFRGFRKNYIDQYINYVLLRSYYEKNKVLLTTKNFDKEKALNLLETFSNRRLTPASEMILLEEYGEDYENKVVPKYLTDQVPNIYNVRYSSSLLNPNRYFPKTVVHVLKGSLYSGILLGLIVAVAWLVIGITTGRDLILMAMNNPFSIIVFGVLILVMGVFRSRKHKKYYPFEDAIGRNPKFKKHIKSDMKERIKTLRYRIKKEGKLNKSLGR